MSDFIPYEANGRLLMKLRFEISKELHSSYQSRVKTISKPQFTIMITGYVYNSLYRQGYKMRTNYDDFELMNLIKLLDIPHFNERTVTNCHLFNALRFKASLHYLVDEGYFSKIPGDGNYYLTDRFHSFWDAFDKEFIKCVHKFSYIKTTRWNAPKKKKKKKVVVKPVRVRYWQASDNYHKPV